MLETRYSTDPPLLSKEPADVASCNWRLTHLATHWVRKESYVAQNSPL